MILRGDIIADCVVTPGVPSGTCALSTNNPVAGRITQIFGNREIDTIQFGDQSGLDLNGSKTTLGSDGYIFLGSKTRAYGSNTLPPLRGTKPRRRRPRSVADGRRRSIYRLVFAVRRRCGVAGRPGHRRRRRPFADARWPADTDYYAIYTTGSHGAVRNYVINVLDTGAANDGVDELTIYGYDNNDPGFNGYVTGTLTKNKTDDIFLLRATKCIDTESPFGVTDADVSVPTNCTSPTETADHPAFVALLHGNNDADGGLGGYRSRIVGDEASKFVQRINYDAALNGRLNVYGLGGNDYFAVDDNSAITSLDGGAGYDTFQIGQIFGMKRDADEGALLPQDTFPVLVATTRGWLSPGTHAR